jgi:cobalt-zinc-cadmium efflux system outer membrane protein
VVTIFRLRRWLPKAPRAWLVAAALAGCCHPAGDPTERLAGELAARPLDALPPPPPAKEPEEEAPAGAGPEAPKPPTAVDRLDLPPSLPSALLKPFKLPPPGPEFKQEREAAIRKYYPPLPEPPPGPDVAPGPEGRPLTLADLQRLALRHNPQVRQAAAAVDAARGAAVQARLPPNPTVGYEGDTAATGGLPGYQGGYFEQTIKTAGKLELAYESARVDVANAELNLREVRNDVATRVRSGYFAVLIARDNLKVARAVVVISDAVYKIQFELFQGAQAAAYEPLALRAQAFQARGQLVQAQNRYVAAWKQLAAALGVPDLPLSELDGAVEAPIPDYAFEAALRHILEGHTDVLAAQNTRRKEKIDLRLAQLTPVPDVDLRVMLQKDYTSPTFLLAHSVQVGIPVPLWDRNQGNIQQAQASLFQATQEAQRVRNDLTARLTEAYERYLNYRQLVEYYRRNILPDQVRVYRGVVERYQAQADSDRLNFNDVAVAQQTFVASVTAYLNTLGLLWQAVVDVAGLLQTDELFQGARPTCSPFLPELVRVLTDHPCRPSGAGGEENVAPAAPAPAQPPPDRQEKTPEPVERLPEPADWKVDPLLTPPPSVPQKPAEVPPPPVSPP